MMYPHDRVPQGARQMPNTQQYQQHVQQQHMQQQHMQQQQHANQQVRAQHVQHGHPLVKNGMVALDASLHDIFRALNSAFKTEQYKTLLETLVSFVEEFSNRCDQIVLYCVSTHTHALLMLLLSTCRWFHAL